MPETTAMFRVTIASTIDAVWNEITKTDEPIPAFFNSRMDVLRLAPGSRLAMRTADGKYTGVVGEILEFDPPRRFAHTFRFTNFEDPPCKVIYSLEEVAGGVQFTLEIEDLPPGTKTAKQMLQGGKMIVNTLKSVMETGRPSMGIRVLYRVFKLMQPLSPKRCASVHWPVDD
ncbi:MAG: SRPBCC domain-containing protein [Planctomycetes bacterium]|nr:SRPBCC domain-containing protein [Planctomycetota bacterium]MCB9919777.1 SRPBCC domain-containing protein [Planctomycetota bacterium]